MPIYAGTQIDNEMGKDRINNGRKVCGKRVIDGAVKKGRMEGNCCDYEWNEGKEELVEN